MSNRKLGKSMGLKPGKKNRNIERKNHRKAPKRSGKTFLRSEKGIGLWNESAWLFITLKPATQQQQKCDSTSDSRRHM